MLRFVRTVTPSSLLGFFIVLLAVNALLSYRSVRTIAANESRVSHTFEVLGDLEAMFSTVKDAQRGARGYVLTPEDRFLAPFENAKTDFAVQFRAVQHLTADNPRQQQRLAEFQKETLDYFEYLAAEITARRKRGFAAAEALIETGATQRTIDNLGNRIQEMEAEERALLAGRVAQTQRSIRTAVVNISIATGIAVLLLVLAYTLIIRGINSRLRYAEELESTVRQRTAELQEVNTALEAFNYSVSHDLRAPLRGMSGLGIALLEDYADHLDETGKRYATGIVAAARKMDALIDGLLLYSRVSRAKIELHPMQLATAVRDALAQLESEINSRNASVGVRHPLPVVIGQPNLLIQAIANLISNGIKFQASGVKPQVTVWAETFDAKVRLIVRDNGIGIAPEHQERIFGAFERLHGVEAYEGSGLGLSIARSALQRMRGDVGVKSEVGSGSEFWLELPLAKD